MQDSIFQISQGMPIHRNRAIRCLAYHIAHLDFNKISGFSYLDNLLGRHQTVYFNQLNPDELRVLGLRPAVHIDGSIAWERVSIFDLMNRNGG